MAQVEEHEHTKDCVICKLSVGLGMALNVCKSIEPIQKKVNCDELAEKVQAGELSDDDVYNKLIQICDEVGEPDVKADLEEMKRLAKGEGQ